MKRRAFLKIAGGGVVLAAAGVGANAMRRPTAALAPWDAPGAGYADPRMRALSHAILAPNPHNLQPWLVALEGEDTVLLHVDRGRLLPQTDPFNRQITIGLGCFLEMLRMAAAEEGIATEIVPFPEGGDADALDDRPVARVTFGGVAAPDPLFAHHMARRSLKEPFDTARPVPAEVLARIVAAGGGIGRTGGTVDADEVSDWRALTEAALRIEVETPHTFRESVDLFRIGAAEVNANPDGIDFSGPTFETLRLFGLFDREATLDPTSAAFAQGMEAVLDNARTAMGHVWIVTPGNGRADQIATGADWLRINLAATAEEVGFQPLSQALQEYPEMSALYRDTHDRLAPDGGTVQMLARIGYGPQVPPSPRWGIEAKLIG